MKISIIGAGIAGISVSALLANQGHKVTVFEKNSTVGGRARELKENGYTFDMGPSWYLMPDVFEQYFALFGKKPSDYYELIKLDPSYKVFLEETEFTVSPDLEKTYKFFDTLEPNGGEKLKKYLQEAENKYKIATHHFIDRPYQNFTELLDPQFLRLGNRLSVFENLDKYVSRYFESETAKKILHYTVVFLGGAPKNTPALYSLMSYVDLAQGVYYPKGGIISFVKGLEKLAIEQGVEFRFNSNVSKIIVQDGVARGIISNEKEEKFDLVVVNADYQFAETVLLEEKYQSYNYKYWEKAIIAPSAFLMYLGLNREPTNLEHHNLMLAHNWETHFDEIFENPKWPTKPSYYVSRPSKTDKSVVPEGKENIFVLIPIASGLEDTPEIRQKYEDFVFADLSRHIGFDISKEIDFKKVYTINDFKHDYNSYKGNALGLAHTLFQTAIFRPKNKSKKVSGLYYTGHYTNPGIGVPIALISAQIVSKLIKKYELSD